MTAATCTPLHLRWLMNRDMPDVLAIEEASFFGGWTADEFAAVMRERSCIGVVAERAGQVAGYMIYKFHARHIEVLNFAVAPQHRRQGVGTSLVCLLKAKLHARRRTRVTANVREGNLRAQLFLRSQGFTAVRVLRNYYEDTGEDAFRFVWRMPTREVVP